jgi:hypothetical protein
VKRHYVNGIKQNIAFVVLGETALYKTVLGEQHCTILTYHPNFNFTNDSFNEFSRDFLAALKAILKVCSAQKINLERKKFFRSIPRIASES